MEIRSREDAQKAFDKILQNLLKGRICHFLVSYGTIHGDATVCTMIPVGVIKERGQEKHICIPFDYLRWLIILATHPRISELEYDEKENTVKAVFTEPEEWAEPEDEEW